ncbi:hypothetical protein MRY82_04865 [bacterium]|nr:hypothetical protein [bacterium]
MHTNIKNHITSLCLLLTLIFTSSCGQSTASNGESFILNNPVVSVPEAPSSLRLWDFSTDDDCIVRLRWRDNSTTEQNFTIERYVYNMFDINPQITNLSYNSSEEEIESSDMRYLFDALPNASVYVEYRIRSENTAGYSDWSPFEGLALNSCFP